jgi:uncharacterized coiled-coil protein SlyX
LIPFYFLILFLYTYAYPYIDDFSRILKRRERTVPHGRTCTRGSSPYLVGGASGSWLHDASQARLPHYRVRMTLEPHPLQPGWHSLDFESFEYRAEDTIEAIALHGLTTFCGFHPLELSTHPIGLFPAEKEDDPIWKDRVEHAKDIWALYPGQTTHLTVRCMDALYRLQVRRGEAMSHLMALLEATKITLDNREELVVDLSTEMVEKDQQVEQMSNEIQELEELVGTRENTIEVLEDQLINTQQQLAEANQHLDMHHQEIQDMEANEDVDIEGGEEPEPASSLDIAGSGRPPSPESSVALFAH